MESKRYSARAAGATSGAGKGSGTGAPGAPSAPSAPSAAGEREAGAAGDRGGAGVPGEAGAAGDRGGAGVPGEAGAAGDRGGAGVPGGAGNASEAGGARRRRRIANEIKDSLRDLSVQLTQLNHQVVAHLDLNDADLHCLELLNRHGPLGPGGLARLAGLHPATVTGILDRLERGGWIVRERDSADRRAVLVRPLRARNPELLRLFAGMNELMDDVCAAYTEAELRLIADFLRRTGGAGQEAAADLAGG
jgi:DNA-binding MarR family transcriptional regulator